MLKFTTFKELYLYLKDKWPMNSQVTDSPNKLFSLLDGSLWYNGDEYAESSSFSPIFNDKPNRTRKFAKIKQIELDEDNRMIIIDGCIALKYA